VSNVQRVVHPPYGGVSFAYTPPTSGPLIRSDGVAYPSATTLGLGLAEWIICAAPRGRFYRAVVILILIGFVLVAWNLPALSAFAP
jgi:hypothetical protein